MVDNAPSNDDLSMHFFYACELFKKDEIETLLNQPQWESRYPSLIRARNSPDKLTRCQIVLPAEIVLAIARTCTPLSDFFTSPDGQTLYTAARGGKPFQHHIIANNQVLIEDIDDAKLISVEHALIEYGVDAVWLAQDIGKSRKGA